MIPFKHTLALLIALACMAALHHFFRYTTASLFIAPIGIACLLATISPTPVALIALFTLSSELLTTLPFGTMVIIFALPFAVLWLMKRPEVDITWKFFFSTVVCIALQILVLLIAKNGLHILTIQEIPFGIAGLQLLCTSTVTYAIVVAYNEYTSRI